MAAAAAPEEAQASREASLKDLSFSPGVVSNSSARGITGRWKDTNRVRWHKGLLEKIGGWANLPLTGSNNGVYIGTARAVWDWASLDGQQWIAFGTESKLYLVNNATLYDITPIRKVSNLSNALTTTAGSKLVTITELDHRVNPQDNITIVAPGTTVGGLALVGSYTVVAVTDFDHYVIQAASAATSSQTGGGAITVNYDIYAGLAENGFLYGYGAGTYGEFGYGNARPVGSGIPAKMRIWSLQNWGEDLVASYTDGEIYRWTRANGPNAPAVLMPQPAPLSVQRILVNADSEFLIAIGAQDLSGAPDNMNVRWCSQGDLTDWYPTAAIGTQVANSAGGQRLNFGSRLMTGIQTNTGNLVWSDTTLYSMQYVGQPNIFGFNPIGSCKLVSPNAIVDVGGKVYMMVFDDFQIFTGTIETLPCDVWEYVFGDFDRTQAESVFCAHYSTKNEVTWFYDAESQVQRRYVTYNYADACWYYGAMERTAYHDVSAVISGFMEYPYGLNGGYLYQHEVGTDEVEPTGINAMDYWAESWDIGSQSDAPVLINSIVPDFPIIPVAGAVQLLKGLAFTINPREYPNQQGMSATVFPPKGPFIVTPSTERVDVRANGTQSSLMIQAARATWTDTQGVLHTSAIVFGQWFRMGVWQALATPYGKRLGVASAGAPIDTSGP